MSVARKIALTRQLEEMKLLASEQRTELGSGGRRRGLTQGVIDERLERQAAIVATLEWLRENEAAFREWAAARRGQADEPTTG